MIVNTDDVLDLFGASDEDFYAKGTIEDAIYNGTLRQVEPERKCGKWIKKRVKVYCPGDCWYPDSCAIEGTWNEEEGSWEEYQSGFCSECDRHRDWKSNFCPWCGADMRGDQDG